MRFWHQLLLRLESRIKLRMHRTEALAKGRFLAQLEEWRERLPRQKLQQDLDEEIIELAELILQRASVAPPGKAPFDDPAGKRS